MGDAQLSAFMVDAFHTVSAMGGAPALAKLSAIIMLLIASMKVTILNKWVWSRLGGAQVLVAPTLGLIAGLLGLGAGGAPLTPALVLTYVAAGGGAVFLHEILDAVKVIPGLGAIYVNAISLLEGALGGGAAAPVPAVEVASADPGHSDK